ncbi:unnamed protein product [Larinioides sclopetarius]
MAAVTATETDIIPKKSAKVTVRKYVKHTKDFASNSKLAIEILIIVKL